mmetsp:Transcript_26802/g.75201  ORF Transcript_26802/g.75201 Transcript_26802/m.75201 type:complete len:211 (+) Transcript_26802:3080-3712(+)
MDAQLRTIVIGSCPYRTKNGTFLISQCFSARDNIATFNAIIIPPPSSCNQLAMLTHSTALNVAPIHPNSSTVEAPASCAPNNTRASRMLNGKSWIDAAARSHFAPAPEAVPPPSPTTGSTTVPTAHLVDTAMANPCTICPIRLRSSVQTNRWLRCGSYSGGRSAHLTATTRPWPHQTANDCTRTMPWIWCCTVHSNHSPQGACICVAHHR